MVAHVAPEPFEQSGIDQGAAIGVCGIDPMEVDSPVIGVSNGDKSCSITSAQLLYRTVGATSIMPVSTSVRWKRRFSSDDDAK